MIKIDKLTKVYKSKRKSKVKALNNINLTLPNNGLVFVLGKSGSGKSTLLNLIGGLDNITEGKIIVDGNDISNFKEKEYCDYRNNHIGFIFQDYHLIDELTVYDNICLSLNLRRIEDKDLVKNALEKVDLEGYEERYPTELSGGERQRVAIARAFIKKPRIILADEPTGNLDTATSTQIIELLKSLSNECLILIVSHNKNDAYKYADRIIELSKGNIINDIIKNPEYLDEIKCENNIIYYPSDKILNANDIDLINNNINKNTKVIKVDNKFIASNNEYKTEEKTIIEKKNLTLIKDFMLSLKFLKNKIINIFLYSFMVSAIMIILALALTIIKFDSGKIMSEEMSKLGENSIVVEKKLSDEKITQYGYNYVLEVHEDDKNSFSKHLDKDKIYPLYSLTIPVSQSNNLFGLKIHTLTDSFYFNETLGTLVVDNELLESKFGQLEFVAEAEEQLNTGIYITDYVADSIIMKNAIYKNKTYKDIVGNYVVASRSWGYINGIIKTDYKEKYNSLFKNITNKNVNLSEYYENPEFIKFTTDIYSTLGYSYSLNPNFKDDIVVSNQYDFVYIPKIKFNNNIVTASAKNYILLEKKEQNYNLKDNEVVMSYKKYNELFGTNYDTNNLNTFVPHTVNFKEFRHYDEQYLEPIVDEELYIKKIVNTPGFFICNEEMFAEIFEANLFTKGYLISDFNNIDEIIELTKELNYEQKSLFIESIHTMTKAVTVFIPIFRLIAIVLCLGIIFILVSFSSKMIKDKMHDIGILKALGMQNKSIVIVFGLQICLIAVVTMLMSTFGYYFFIDLANDVLIASLKELAPSHILLDLDFLTFKLIVVGFNIVLIMILSIISLVIPMIKIKNIKPVKIIKTKE